MAHNQPKRIAELEREIRELEASLPAHSVTASMLIRLEDLEEELEELKAAPEVAVGDRLTCLTCSHLP